MLTNGLKLVPHVAAEESGQHRIYTSESPAFAKPRSGAEKLPVWMRRVMNFLWPAARRPMHQITLVETVSLGARRQLMLFSCAGERFLIATGPDSVTSPVRVRPDEVLPRSMDPKTKAMRVVGLVLCLVIVSASPVQAQTAAPAAQAEAATKPSAATPNVAAKKKAAPAPKADESIADALSKGGSTPWAIVVGLTLLTLLPAMLLAMTPMVRLLVVFHFLRQALGTQTAPSNQVLMGLALMMTWFLMQPVLVQVEQVAVTPYREGSINGEVALDRGMQPVKHYMLRYAREKDLAVFASAGLAVRPKSADDLPIQVVIPAYILSELKAGFQIGAILFLPFLLVDLVVASITTSIGMMQLPPVVISTPLKILLFVMVDGWNLLADKLLKSF
jgi:flagellar biosynthetic protein FliP